MAYIVMAVFLAFSGFFFASSMSQPFPEATVRGFLFPGALALLLLAPVLTMRLLAEEQKMGTLELLLTAPVRDSEIVLGKFLASFIMVAVTLALTLYFPFLLFLFGGDPDLVPILTGYLVLLLVGAMAVSVGIFGSALTSNQIVAAVLSTGLLMVLWLANLTSNLAGGSEIAWKTAVDYLAISGHMQDLAFGILNTTDLVYFVTVIAFFLFVTIRVLETRRWR
ncbi:MAG: ABC transporter permease subunit [Chloroflexi bacterium]|nr:ABC transporter permease subunit [Chloroflexota bacterium]